MICEVVNAYLKTSQSASGAGGNITFLGSLPVVTATNGGAITLTFSNFRDASNNTITLAQNDFVVVAYNISASGDLTPALSSSGWTSQADLYQIGTSANHADANLAIFTKKMGAVPDTSCVTTAPGGSTRGCAGVAFVFRGVDTTTPLDVALVSASNNTLAGSSDEKPDPPLITPVTNGSWVVVVGASASLSTSATYTNPGDLSSGTNHFRAGSTSEDRAPALGMGFNNTWTTSFDPTRWTSGPATGTGSWIGVCLALRSS